MRKWLVLLGLGALATGVVLLCLSYFGVKLINAELKKVAGPGLRVEGLKLKWTHLALRGIRYQDAVSGQKWIDIEEARIYPTLFASLRGTVRIRECQLLGASFFFHRSREGGWRGPWPVSLTPKTRPSSAKEANKANALSLRIDRIRIRKGVLDIRDEKADAGASEFHFEDLDFDLKEIQYPFVSAPSPFELRGRTRGKTKNGTIFSKGWIDLKTTEMEASLTLRGIEVKLFEPYYRRRDSAEIESGQAHLGARIRVRDQWIEGIGELELLDLGIKEGEGTVFWIPAKMLASWLRDRGHRIKVPFHVRGNIADPEFKLDQKLLVRIGLSMAESLGLPARALGEEVLEGTVRAGKGVAEDLNSQGELPRRRKETKR